MSNPITPASLNEGDKNYLLHLYDALWENMRSKESRLWTFLSLYGAAVGLVFAGGQVSQIPGADLLAIMIVMGLSTWAVLIILNTNWWYYRNQLMVSRIEIRFPDAVKGVVPKIYNQNPNYRFDQLSEGSILLLSLLLFFLYSRTIWSYHSPGSINILQSLVVVVLLYVLFIFSAVYCLRLHESNIEAYYGAKKDILEDTMTKPLPPEERLRLLKDQTRIRQNLDARWRVLLLLILVAGLFDFITFRNGISPVWLSFVILFQAAAAVMFLVQRHFYREGYSEEDLKHASDLIKAGNPNDVTLNRVLEGLEDNIKVRYTKDKVRRFWHSVWHMMLLVSLSAAIAILALYKGNQKLRDDWRGSNAVNAGNLGQQITKMQNDVQNIQKTFNELQQSNVQLQKQLLDEKLAPYTKRDEAEQRFVTREELDKIIDARVKASTQK